MDDEEKYLNQCRYGTKGCRQKAVFQLFLLKKTESTGCKQQKQWKKGNKSFGAKIKGSVQKPAAKLTETQDKKRKGQFFVLLQPRDNITQ